MPHATPEMNPQSAGQVTTILQTVEKLASEKLMENVHMQGFRNRGPARRVGSPSEARTNPEE
ncbi:MAG: hypothetical protein PVH82_02885 [Desulfobacteraceae bacterium]|jgi:hypothetical protein